MKKFQAITIGVFCLAFLFGDLNMYAQAEVSLLAVRRAYEKQTGEQWDDADPDAQKDFLRRFKRQERRLTIKERLRKAREERLDRRKMRKIQAERRELDRRRRNRELAEMREQREKARERRERKREIAEMKREMQRQRRKR